MKKRTSFIIATTILLIIIGVMSYKVIAGNNIKNKTYEFLETKGYNKNDISNIEVKHSFLNKILSYNEWRIFVEFESEPDIIFAFTYRNKEIIKQGVTSDDLLDKDEIREYDEKFKNGELKNKFENQVLSLSFELDGKIHKYNIEYDSDNIIVKVDNTDYYEFLEDGELITDVTILDTELTDYFVKNGGKSK